MASAHLTEPDAEFPGKLLDVDQNISRGEIIDHHDLAHRPFSGQQKLPHGLAALHLVATEPLDPAPGAATALVLMLSATLATTSPPVAPLGTAAALAATATPTLTAATAAA